MPPPGLFSITTGWPTFCESCSPMVRVMLSMAPPAPSGMTMETGLFG
jgi:hypothetical protein